MAWSPCPAKESNRNAARWLRRFSSDRDLRMDSSVRSSSSVNCKGLRFFGKGMTHLKHIWRLMYRYLENDDLEPTDLESYVALQGVARAFKQHDTMEYWKSSPYLLSFMESYSLKQNLKDGAQKPEVIAAFKAADRHSGVQLPWTRLRSYKEIDAQNAR